MIFHGFSNELPISHPFPIHFPSIFHFPIAMRSGPLFGPGLPKGPRVRQKAVQRPFCHAQGRALHGSAADALKSSKEVEHGGFIWIYNDLYGLLWIYMDLYGFIWIYMD